MIYYFSGTGNSQWVAEQLAVRTKDTALFIPHLFKNMQKDIDVGPDEVVGVVFPVYAWAAPEIVIEFLHHVHVDEKAYAYAVCTCGSEVGKTFENLHTVFPFKSAYSIAMPDNYIPLFDLDKPELIREKLNVAQQRLPIIAMNVNERSEVIDIAEGVLASIKTSIINPLFVLQYMKGNRFSVEKSCTGCGLCERLCPLGTIHMIDGKPTWSGRCQQCMSCIMHCPVHAIQCGRSTRNRKRYLNPLLFKQSAPQAKPSAPQMTRPVIQEKIEPANASFAQASALWKQKTVFPQEVVTTNNRSPSTSVTAVTPSAAGHIEFIAQKDIVVLEKDRLISRQLIAPVTSKSTRVTVTEVHLQLGAVQERHVHATSEQIWYALRGTGMLLLANNEERELVAGDVVRFPENTVHGIRNTGTDEFIYISVTTPPIDFRPAYKQ